MVAAAAWVSAATPEGQEPSGSSVTEEEEIAVLRERVKALEENLALAKSEADAFYQRWLELRLRVEALGIEALTSSEKALEEKVVRLIGELYRSERDKLALEEAVVSFLEAWKALQLAGPLNRVQRRAELEVARRELLKFIEPDQPDLPAASDLNSGSVVVVDRDLGIAVVNFGRVQGARSGMPFRILREDRVIARCRVVEVRDAISAVQILETSDDVQVQEGDRLLLETGK